MAAATPVTGGFTHALMLYELRGQLKDFIT